MVFHIVKDQQFSIQIFEACLGYGVGRQMKFSPSGRVLQKIFTILRIMCICNLIFLKSTRSQGFLAKATPHGCDSK
jgi:hypothetical protein